MVETIVAGTAGAAQTQTAVLAPATSTVTLTPTVTRTPSPQPTSTATFIWSLRSPTPQKTATPTLGLGATSSEYACRLMDQDPQDGVKMKPLANFDMRWTVRNTGSLNWDAGSIDFAFFNGDKLHKKAIYDLPSSVKSGATIDLIVDMVAPKDAGKYRTVWALKLGRDDFCRVSLSMSVK